MNALAFELPSSLEVREPAESRGLARDGVRLLVAGRSSGELEHRNFADLPMLLEPGDLLVINVSATIPAAVAGRRGDGSELRVHVSTRVPRLDRRWRVVELRNADGTQPLRGRPGEVIEVDGGGKFELVASYASGARLLLARFDARLSLEDHLAGFGQPIRYGYVHRCWPLESYQNVYSTTPGSAEMPSAGRPFTPELITRLVAKGVLIAPITLHAGVSSPERHEAPFPEQFEVPEVTAALVDSVRSRGGRVIAVGTTVVRALETAVAQGGVLVAGVGWTSLVIAHQHQVRVVDGLITGWHEPQASHLQMLEAIAGNELLTRSYQAALEHSYLWHEFGDSHLIL